MQLLQRIQGDGTVEGLFLGVVAAAAEDDPESLFLGKDLKHIHAVGDYSQPGQAGKEGLREEISGAAAVDADDIIFFYKLGGDLSHLCLGILVGFQPLGKLRIGTHTARRYRAAMDTLQLPAALQLQQIPAYRFYGNAEGIDQFGGGHRTLCFNPREYFLMPLVCKQIHTPPNKRTISQIQAHVNM